MGKKSKQKSTSTSDAPAWLKPYIIGGGGQIPAWLSAQPPSQLSPQMSRDMAARAAGALGSWNSPPPLMGAMQMTPIGLLTGLPVSREQELLNFVNTPIGGLLGGEILQKGGQ